MNFDFKNGCKNEFEDNNGKSSADSKMGSPLKSIKSRLDSRVHPDSLRIKIKKNYEKIFHVENGQFALEVTIFGKF